MKVGRNEPCPCGSGKKFKRCCLNGDGHQARVLPFDRSARSDDVLERRRELQRDLVCAWDALVGPILNGFGTSSSPMTRVYGLMSMEAWEYYKDAMIHGVGTYAAFGPLGDCEQRKAMVAALPAAQRSAYRRLADAEYAAYRVSREGRSFLLRRLRRPNDDVVRLDAQTLSDWNIDDDAELLFGFLLRGDDIGATLVFPYVVDPCDEAPILDTLEELVADDPWAHDNDAYALDVLTLLAAEEIRTTGALRGRQVLPCSETYFVEDETWRRIADDEALRSFCRGLGWAGWGWNADPGVAPTAALAEATTEQGMQRLLRHVSDVWDRYSRYYLRGEFQSRFFLKYFGLDSDGGCPAANERLAALPFAALELDWERADTIASVRAAGIRPDAPLLEGIARIEDPAFLGVVEGLRDVLLERLRWGVMYPLVMAQLHANINSREREILRLENLAAGVAYFPRSVGERSLRDLGVSAGACGRVARALGHEPTVDDVASQGGWEFDDLPGVGPTTVAEVAGRLEDLLLELVEVGFDSAGADAAARLAGAEEAVAGLDELESLFSSN